MHYRKIWENYHNQKIPPGYDIHHLDGNRKNNNIENLICLSIEDHLKVHQDQDDWGAVQAILMRIENRSEINNVASKFQKQLLEKNVHNFQKMPKDRRSEISKKTIEKRLNNGNNAFLNIQNIQENARLAGKKAAEKKAGFLNPQSNHHGSKFVKNTSWWTHIETGKRIRREFSPGNEWKKGMNKE